MIIEVYDTIKNENVLINLAHIVRARSAGASTTIRMADNSILHTRETYQELKAKCGVKE